MRRIQNLTDISGAFFCFESHLGVTQASGAVSAWTDTMTGSGLVAANATSAKRPAYTASNASFNGYPSIDWPFARLADQIYLETGPLASPVAAKPMTFITVFQCSDFTASRILFSNRFPTTTYQASLLVTSTGALRITGKTPPFVDSPASTVVANQATVAVTVVNSMATHFKNNLTAIARGACGNFLMDGIRLGNTGFDSAGSVPFSGSIAVCAGWSRELGAGEVARALNLLVPRYNVAALPSRTAKTRAAVPAPGAVGGRTWIL